MLNWILKKTKAPVGTPAADASLHPRPDSRSTHGDGEQDSASAIDWDVALQAAVDDDTALLALARAGAPVAVRVAAVRALTGEAALKLAEREHRNSDRRVHRVAKQRHLAKVALRETAGQASQLVEAAKALLDQSLIPA